ncbi:hypothetical protein IEQ34_016517 [Dendrobium chrysotoxum]|uniref:Uncharacterized protein n=1 Tax=Dendrobium chrysotoxum TaxID=161865 RepID=A0AAV7GGP7_DENCH|nr:hypothetical protein IEQ34_016517 [Dendrobium chrysotoxum]
MAKRLIPAFNRILVEKIVPPTKTNTGILLPEKNSKVGLDSCSCFLQYWLLMSFCVLLAYFVVFAGWIKKISIYTRSNS